MYDKRFLSLFSFVLLLGLGIFDATAIADTSTVKSIERGKYVVTIAGCNDCHTPGYAQSDGQTPEELWLTGDSFGWRGPWGTTYPSNLRTLAQSLSEDQWVLMARNLKTRPPMPWFNLNKMEDADLRAIFQYLLHLGPGGQAAPTYVPADRDPNPPYALFPAPPPQ